MQTRGSKKRKYDEFLSKSGSKSEVIYHQDLKRRKLNKASVEVSVLSNSHCIKAHAMHANIKSAIGIGPVPAANLICINFLILQF